jgi:pimeloyl-ACP methyl ester carboxylesterase
MQKPLILMIHGARHWGGCFQKVADQLALQRLFQRDMPCAEVRTLAGASHLPFFSRPQELAKVISALAIR